MVITIFTWQVFLKECSPPPSLLPYSEVSRYLWMGFLKLLLEGTQ